MQNWPGFSSFSDFDLTIEWPADYSLPKLRIRRKSQQDFFRSYQRKASGARRSLNSQLFLEKRYLRDKAVVVTAGFRCCRKNSIACLRTSSSSGDLNLWPCVGKTRLS